MYYCWLGSYRGFHNYYGCSNNPQPGILIIINDIGYPKANEMFLGNEFDKEDYYLLIYGINMITTVVIPSLDNSYINS